MPGGSPYASNYWLTFKQAQELGGTVRKGEKGTQIVFWKKFVKETNETASPTTPEGTAEDRARFMCRTYTVFHVEQCDDLSIPAPVIDRPQIDANEHEGRFLSSQHRRRTHAYPQPLCGCPPLLLNPVS